LQSRRAAERYAIEEINKSKVWYFRQHLSNPIISSGRLFYSWRKWCWIV
jgi:hypothetical protein